MATGAHFVAAMAAHAEREIRDHFEQRYAFDPAHAVAYDPPSAVHQQQFDSLFERGILLDTGDGRFWLDRAAVRGEEERHRVAGVQILKILLIALALLVAGTAIVAALR